MVSVMDKRLLSFLGDSKRYIIGNVVFQWISLCMNIVLMMSTANLIQKLYQGTAETANLITLGVIALLAYLVVGICIPVIISKQSGSDGIEHREKSGALATFMLDSLRGLSEILQYDAGAKRIEELQARTDDLSASREHMKKVEGRNAGMTNTIVLLADFTMLFAAMYFYRSGVIGFESVLIPTIALMSSFGPVIALAALGSTLQNTFAAGDRVLDILDEEPAFEDVVLKPKTEYAGAVAENITFAYGDGAPVLSDFSLEIPEDTVIGITGKSGSGKSTFLKLLMRFWETKQGRVLISGKDIGKVNTEDLRAMEAYVTQETHLFHDSIANNVRIAKLDATQEEIEAACKKASVHDFIMTLPKGYDTPVGELGDTLSGGQLPQPPVRPGGTLQTLSGLCGTRRVLLHEDPGVSADRHQDVL